ncbi:MAG: cytochrome C oxidase subunit IV family protein [Parachlamydia sp.]|jgi:cytochrome o ubiquinol oxidase operon protein cyoD|nr:cytochrome C oxidase subunit IV family protein [Parachlamydia sp.]
MHYELTYRVTGLIASLILTLAAYFIIVNPHFFNTSNQAAFLIAFSLALTQSLVQLIFFIDVWKEKGVPWNFWIFVSTVSIIVIVVGFSIWIINHLNYNMH